YKVSVGKKVVVIGGGNVAIDVARSVTRESMAKASATEDGSATMDAARTALRIGAEEVHVVCLESREEMPAFEYEVEEAEKEGIILHPSRGPKRIIGEDGRVAALETIRCSSVFDEDGRFNPKFEEHTETVLPADSVIMAIGQRADLSFIQPADGIDVTPHDTIRVNPETLATTAPGVFAGGDVAFGPRIIVDAIADGQKAARSIHLFLREEKIHVESKARMVPLENHSMPPEYLSIPRETMPSIPIKKRLGIAEVQLGFSESQAANEGKRCLKCNINTIFDGTKCILCGGCVDVCPEYCLKMIDLGEAEIDENMRRLIERKLEVDLENGRVLEEREFRKLGTLMIKDEERCIRCGLCARRCPTGAVTMESFEYVEEYVG
ncbi:MAG: FAD-dependent oxidoreductase, partial [Candidatus Aminicenantales bacterium]